MNPAIRRTPICSRKPLTGARRRFPVAATAAVVTITALAHAGTAHAAPRAAPIPGGIAIVRLASAEAAPPQAFYQGRSVLVERRDGAWRALVGIALNAEPGEHRLKVVTAGASGVADRETAFRVMPHAYATQKLTIRDTTKVTPPPDALERIEREQARMVELRTRFRDVASVEADLAPPARGRLSSRFGLRRVLNGEPRNPHGGLDFALPAGTPVTAPAAGVVIDAADYFYCGQSVFVDHGQGLISLYCHLDRIDVAPGQSLRRGERIGLSGASGRATGPHLHWSVYLNGNGIDPELLLAR